MSRNDGGVSWEEYNSNHPTPEQESSKRADEIKAGAYFTEFGCDPDEDEDRDYRVENIRKVLGIGGHIHFGKITLLDRIFGNCEKGIHNFRNILVRSIPPKDLSVKGRGFTFDDYVDGFTEKIYEVRCTRCGKKPE